MSWVGQAMKEWFRVWKQGASAPVKGHMQSARGTCTEPSKQSKPAHLSSVVAPDVTQVGEVHQAGLEGAQDGCQARLALQGGQVICVAHHHLCQVAELVGAQDDLAAAGAHGSSREQQHGQQQQRALSSKFYVPSDSNACCLASA